MCERTKALDEDGGDVAPLKLETLAVEVGRARREFAPPKVRRGGVPPPEGASWAIGR